MSKSILGVQVLLDVKLNPGSQRSHFPAPLAPHPYVVQFGAQTTTEEAIHSHKGTDIVSSDA